MKSNLTEGDYQICELLRGLWMTMEAVAAKLDRRLPDVAWRMTKLNDRGLLDMSNGFYRMSPAKQLGVRGAGAKRNNGCWWATTCKTPIELMEERKLRIKRNKAAAELRKHMRQLERANKATEPKAKKAPAEPKPPQAPRKRKWFGIHPAAELHYGVKAHPKCFPDVMEYKAYLTSLKDSGEKTTSSGICRDCDRATMERMGARCEAPQAIKERMEA